MTAAEVLICKLQATAAANGEPMVPRLGPQTLRRLAAELARLERPPLPRVKDPDPNAVRPVAVPLDVVIDCTVVIDQDALSRIGASQIDQ